VVDYINTLFPTEQSLAGLDETIGDLNARVEEIEQETRNMVRSQVGVSRLFPGLYCYGSVRIRIQLFN
jgi:hypothetical protein